MGLSNAAQTTSNETAARHTSIFAAGEDEIKMEIIRPSSSI
jgi:hypothetical protein